MNPAAPPLTPAQSQRLRAAYPHLSSRTYLDTAAVGLAFEGQGQAVARFFDALKSRGWDGRPGWLEASERAKRRVAALVRVDAADAAWLGSTTEGLNLAAHSLRWRPGDRVVLAADEFVSVLRAFDVARAAGAEVVEVPIAREAERAQRLLDALDARTRVLAVSQVHSSTGTRLDLAPLARACRERDALLVVDGIQALGAVAVDASPADVYCSAFFKWMLGSFGLALFATSARARERMTPAFVGYANHGVPGRPAGFQYAHSSLPGVFALDAALDHVEALGWPVVQAQVAHLAARVADGVAALGVEVVTPAAARAGIVGIAWPGAAAAQRELGARGISVAERDGLLRVSPHFYNSDADVDRLLEALRSVPR